MKEQIKNQAPPKQAPHKLDKEPGKEGFQHGNTGIPDQEVIDEDAKAEQQYEKAKPKHDTDENRKIVNEEEQNQVVNDDESATATQPAKMKAE
jgi:hypothetical protein